MFQKTMPRYASTKAEALIACYVDLAIGTEAWRSRGTAQAIWSVATGRASAMHERHSPDGGNRPFETRVATDRSA